MNWKDQYRAALIEIDPGRLLSLIHDTEVAMSVRSESLPAVTMQELQEMSDAIRTLRILQSSVQVGQVDDRIGGVQRNSRRSDTWIRKTT